MGVGEVGCWFEQQVRTAMGVILFPTDTYTVLDNYWLHAWRL